MDCQSPTLLLRSPSRHCAVNRNAQVTPHVDSRSGQGQSVSMIAGLGNFTGASTKPNTLPLGQVKLDDRPGSVILYDKVVYLPTTHDCQFGRIEFLGDLPHRVHHTKQLLHWLGMICVWWIGWWLVTGWLDNDPCLLPWHDHGFCINWKDVLRVHLDGRGDSSALVEVMRTLWPGNTPSQVGHVGIGTANFGAGSCLYAV